MPTLVRATEAIHVQELARLLGAEVAEDADLEITGVETIADAGPTEITFLANAEYALQVAESKAGAILVSPKDEVPDHIIALRTPNPYLAFAQTLEKFYEVRQFAPGPHATAVVPDSCTVADDAHIGAFSVLGENVVVESGCILHPHAVVYDNAHLGAGCEIHSHAVVRENVTLGKNVLVQNGAVVGGDGFGFAPCGDKSWMKIPQVGTVVIEDDVEIQAGTCIDRTSIGVTRIGRGSKLDNMVQVGHGCAVGEDTLLCGQVGIAGSTKIGDRVTMGGQVGVAGHLSIGNDMQFAAQSGIPVDITEPGAYGGAPVMEFGTARRCFVLLPRLPEMWSRIKKLEKHVKRTQAADTEESST